MDIFSIATFIAITKALLILTILVVVHELGHFLTAKHFGIKVEEFGVGIPPRIWGKRIGETLYSINALPIGGFVRLHGESEESDVTEPDRAFIKKPPKVKAAVALAGVLANFIFAIAAFGFTYSITGIPTGDVDPVVQEVSSGSPAAEADIKPGDEIMTLEGEEIDSTNKFVLLTNDFKGQEVEVVIKRGDDELTKKVTPREDPPQGEGPLGVVISDIPEIHYPPLWKRPFVGAFYGLRDTVNFTGEIVGGLFGVAGTVAQGDSPEGFVGPAGILALIIYIVSLGVIPTINFLAIFSVNLAVLNLIPFPPLDGFRVAMTGVEGFFGKKLLPKVETWVHTAGMALLLTLMLYLTVREIPKLLQADSLLEFIESIVPLE